VYRLSLFSKNQFVLNDLGIRQVVREIIEIRLKINNNISLNRIFILISFPLSCENKFPIVLLVVGACDGKTVWSSSLGYLLQAHVPPSARKDFLG